MSSYKVFQIDSEVKQCLVLLFFVLLVDLDFDVFVGQQVAQEVVVVSLKRLQG